MSSSATIACRLPTTATALSFRRSISDKVPNLFVHRTVSPPLLHFHNYSFHPPLAMKKRSPKRLKYSSQRLYKKDNGNGFLYVEVDPSGSDSWKLDAVVEIIKGGGVGVIPTDTVYAIVCDVRSHSSIERLRRIKEIDKTKPLSILCHSLRDIDTYTMGFPRGNDHGETNIFRAVKNCLLGAYTFILPASKALPKQCIRHGSTTTYTTRKNVGVRIPDDAICQAILEKLDSPLISTSVKWPTENKWVIDPVIIADIYEPEGLDFIVDGGVRAADPSTVVDMTEHVPTIIRQGKIRFANLSVQGTFFSFHTVDWMVVKGEKKSTGELFYRMMDLGAPLMLLIFKGKARLYDPEEGKAYFQYQV